MKASSFSLSHIPLCHFIKPSKISLTAFNKLKIIRDRHTNTHGIQLNGKFLIFAIVRTITKLQSVGNFLCLSIQFYWTNYSIIYNKPKKNHRTHTRCKCIHAHTLMPDTYLSQKYMMVIIYRELRSACREGGWNRGKGAERERKK